MAHMDHKQAVELQLAVKYVLGELPPVQRDEYEDHYIDCPLCAKEVYEAAAFTDPGRNACAGSRPRTRWLACMAAASCGGTSVCGAFVSAGLSGLGERSPLEE